MAVMGKTRSMLRLLGVGLNDAVSFVVFSILDVIDFLLCFLYKAADLLIEADQFKPCYCLSAKEPITTTGKILVTERPGESKIVSLTQTQVQLEEISETLYSRPSLVTDHLSKLSVNEFTKKLRIKTNSDNNDDNNGNEMMKHLPSRPMKSTFTVNSTVLEMLQGKIRSQSLNPIITRWSDCDCDFCTRWTCSNHKDSLFVKTQVPKGNNEAKEDVLFIHGFISSSAFWSETLFPNFSETARSSYRFLAIDLLGFGRSPKPSESLYTLKEHLDMIEKSVLERYKVKSFHVVAHSLGCILALALAVRHPRSIKSLTLLAPPYYPVPKGEAGEGRRYVMKKVAPRRVWPPMAFGTSMACWYEHISRTICLLICKNHRVWEFLAKLVTANRMRTFLLEGFFCHTHNAAWHTLHNVLFGTGSNLEGYLDAVRDHLSCAVNLFHGRDDEVIPVGCSYDLQKRVPRASIRALDRKDHITVVVGRQEEFARELEEIWESS